MCRRHRRNPLKAKNEKINSWRLERCAKNRSTSVHVNTQTCSENAIWVEPTVNFSWWRFNVRSCFFFRFGNWSWTMYRLRPSFNLWWPRWVSNASTRFLCYFSIRFCILRVTVRIHMRIDVTACMRNDFRCAEHERKLTKTIFSRFFSFGINMSDKLIRLSADSSIAWLSGKNTHIFCTFAFIVQFLQFPRSHNPFGADSKNTNEAPNTLFAGHRWFDVHLFRRPWKSANEASPVLFAWNPFLRRVWFRYGTKR